MALQSMTGFARTFGAVPGGSASWEIKSVNGKSLELRLRLPPGLDRIEPALRQAVQQRFSRGNMQATLNLTQDNRIAPQPVVNATFLREVAGLARQIETEFGVAPATADGLLSLRGVLDVPETAETEDDRKAMDAALVELLGQALSGLESSRLEEGRSLAALMSGHLDEIEQIVAKVEADPSRTPEAIRVRLREQVKQLVESSDGLDEDRLYAEAALLATKADIREEIDRLTAHVASARKLIQDGGPVGRRLDFLAQEFNRESNTLCAKSNSSAVTRLGLDLKAAVDRFREQVQNLE